MNTCEATPSAAQEIRIQSLGTPEIDSPLSRNLATAGERRVVFTVDEELVDEGAAPRPMSFELAGPRDRIYFDPSKTKCAIVTCGGLCPGINDVIRAIVMTAYNAYRVPSVLGIRYGLQGFIPSYRYDVRELAPRDVEGIHEFGGTILGTSRGPQSSSEIATALERLNISALFIIGGDGTMPHSSPLPILLRLAALLPVMAVHGMVDPFLHCLHDRVGRFLYCILHDRSLALGKMSQHIVGQIHPGRLFSHAHPDSGELLGPQMGDDAFDPVVASGASLGPDPQLSRRQADIVIDHQDVLRVHLIIIGSRPDALAAGIHIRLGL